MAISEQHWFRNARFGLFVHWGMYALWERGEQVLFREHLQPSEYRQRADEFVPTRYDPREWARLAKQAGMRYAVLTAKHHDGYCLWDSALSELTSVKRAANRDLVAEYLEAFRAEGLCVGLYFSLADWQWPAYWRGPQDDAEAFRKYIAYVHGQVRELCTHYGMLDIFWFDGAWPYTPEQWQAPELLAMIRELQPGILINNRTGLDADFGTPEQRIQAEGGGRMWESCLTSVERHWGYHAGERLWKTPEQIIHTLAVVAEGGGNLLLNVGPKPDGSLPTPFVNLLEDVGSWMRLNATAIHDTRPSICESISIGRQTIGPRTIYLHVLYWPGSTLHLCGVTSRVLSARFLADGWPLDIKQDGEHIWIRNLPVSPPDKRNTVIAIEVEGEPQAAGWARDRLWHGDARRMADWSTT